MHILEAVDGSEGWEYPPDFDYVAAERRFLELAQELHKAFDTECRIVSGAYIQDASFHGEISLPIDYFKRRPEWPKHVTHISVLRVSNWGNLATVTDEFIDEF